MKVAASSLLGPVRPTISPIDDRRLAPWLLNRYSDHKWIVCDTFDAARTKIIDFEIPLADGTLLTEADRLHASVKEYAWWIRDQRFGQIDDATTHSVLVRHIINLAHALTLRGLRSFAHLQPYDVEQLVEECRYGADAVLHASERVGAYLARMETENAASPQPFGGLPRYPQARSDKPLKYIWPTAIVELCNLPASAARLPRVAALIGQAARSNGLTKSKSIDAPLEPLANLTAQALYRWLAPMEQMHAMRRNMEAEAIGFRPFAHGAARVAAIKGVGTTRTPIPPPRLVLHLLEHAARWVTDHSEDTLGGLRELRDVRRLATACWILIAAFTARRDQEVDELSANCLDGDDQTGWWLHVYIEKTLQRKEWIPVPNLVARAVRLMTLISVTAREASGSDEIFQWQSTNGNLFQLNVGRYLDDFAAAVETPLHQPRGKSAARWHWNPHQFRRFFAVLYFYRFEGATIEVLSHHLRHFNLEVTIRYVTQDPEVAALWTDVEWGYMGDIARSIVAGERSVSGAMGERLKKTARRLVDLLRRKLQITSPERAGASLAIVMQRQGLVLTPKPWVTCSCPRTRDAAKQAACRRWSVRADNAIGPDFANAGPTICAACPYAIVEGARQPFVDAELSELEAVASEQPRAGTIFGELEAARVVELRHVRDSRYAGAAPLTNTASDEEN